MLNSTQSEWTEPDTDLHVIPVGDHPFCTNVTCKQPIKKNSSTTWFAVGDN